MKWPLVVLAVTMKHGILSLFLIVAGVAVAAIGGTSPQRVNVEGHHGAFFRTVRR